MTLPADLFDAPDHLTFRPLGPPSFEPLLQRLIEVIGWCRTAGRTRLLVDIRDVAGLGPPSGVERVELGQQMALAAGGALSLAMVTPAQLLDSRRLGVVVATARGLSVEAFTDEVAALTWLVGPDAIRPVLETERLRLRWLVPSDAPFIFELTTQPTWLANIGDRGVRDLATAELYIRNGPLASYAANGFGLWCIERKVDGVPVGIGGIIQRAGMELPELAYAILERHQGQKYGGEAAEAALGHARNVLRLAALCAIVNPSNTASIRILEKVGMTYQGPIQMPGDTAPISLYRTDGP